MCNIILKIGCFINTEKLSYRSFQKNFGRSVKKRAPGKFLEILSRKAENAGGRVFEFSSHAFKLSQLCHNCGSIKKKKLSDRHHVCDCGIGAQRDLYSAFLALFVNEKGFDKSRAHLAWPSVESLLERALSKCSETMSGEHKLESFGLNQRQNCSPVKDKSVHTEVLDVVPKLNLDLERAEKRYAAQLLRTP